MKVYIMKADWLPEFLKLATSESTADPAEFDGKVCSSNVNVVEDFGKGELLEGYLDILDDHDIEITGDDNTAKLDASTQGRFAWMKITGKDAQKIGRQVERLKLNAEDFENYFGESDQALMRELETLHRGFKDLLKKIGPNDIAFLRSQL